MKDVRLNRLTQLVHRRASEIVLYDLKDPRLGLVTVTRVKLARDLKHAVIFWSVILRYSGGSVRSFASLPELRRIRA